MKTYESVLPEGYDKVKIINSQDRRDNIVEMICILSPSLLFLIFGNFYCILPRIYVYFKTQLLCTAAPLTFFTITLLLGTVIAVKNGSCVFIVLSGLMAFHFFACRSDMYLIRELFKIRDPHLLIGEDEDGNNIVFKP